MADTQQAGVQATEQSQADEGQDFDKKLSNLVNSAVSAHLKRALPKTIEDVITPHMAKFQEVLQAREAPKAAPSAPAGSSVGSDPEILKQLDDMKAQLKREQDTRLKERQQAREEKAIADVRAELIGKVRPEAVDHVVKLLAHDRMIQVDGATVSLRVGEDALPLKDGLAEFLARKENAIFLPAPSPNQSSPKKPVGLRNVPQRAAPTGGGQRAEREDPLQKTLKDLGLS